MAIAFLIVAIILLIIAALPSVPHGATLARIGLAFGFASFLVGGIGG